MKTGTYKRIEAKMAEIAKKGSGRLVRGLDYENGSSAYQYACKAARAMPWITFRFIRQDDRIEVSCAQDQTVAGLRAMLLDRLAKALEAEDLAAARESFAGLQATIRRAGAPQPIRQPQPSEIETAEEEDYQRLVSSDHASPLHDDEDVEFV